MATSGPNRIADYEILAELGRGATSVVYQARSPRHPTPVALKVVQFPSTTTTEQRTHLLQRLQAEANLAAALRHPNIVRPLEVGRADDAFFLAMELVSGPSLRKRLQMEGPLPLPDLLRLADQICAALEAAHDQGLLHLDIKPDNILLSPERVAKLTDFGIVAVAREALTAPGSPAYMSPEQVSNAGLDARSDIFSLGATLYEAATGRRAFPAEQLASLAHQIVSQDPDYTSLPPALAAVLRVAMIKDPAHRYQRVTDFRVALQRATPELLAPLAAAPAGVTVPCSRHPSRASRSACLRCGRMLCDMCERQTPAGILCADCASTLYRLQVAAYPPLAAGSLVAAACSLLFDPLHLISVAAVALALLHLVGSGVKTRFSKGICLVALIVVVARVLIRLVGGLLPMGH